MKRFEIHRADDGYVACAARPSEWAQVRDALRMIEIEGAQQHGRYFFKGKEVSHAELLEAACEQGDKWQAEQDEKYVTISWKEGACENTRRYAKIRREKARRIV